MSDITLADSQNIKDTMNNMNNINFPLKPQPFKKQLKFICHKDIDPTPQDRLEQLQLQVQLLSKIPQPEQRSQDWYNMRKDKITASDWAAALGKNPYSYRKGLLRTKCGEQKSFFGGYMQHGVKYEPVANMIYEFRNNTTIIEFGLLPHPKIDFLGASPDGITADGVMVEIKCPPKRDITGDPPIYYWIQVQGQLEICGLDRCDFLECKIEEYVLDEDYFDDNIDNNYFYNRLGLEKGLVLVFMNKMTTDLTYKYSKLGMNREEYLEWFKEERKKVLEDAKMLYVETSYWKLTEVSCVPIYRDIKWFEDNLPELRRFWDDVLHYREVGTAEIQPKPRKKKVEDNRIFIDTQITDFKNDSSFKKFNAIYECHNVNKFSKCMFRNIKTSYNSLSDETQITTKDEVKVEMITQDEVKIDKLVRIKIKKINNNISLFSKRS